MSYVVKSGSSSWSSDMYYVERKGADFVVKSGPSSWSSDMYYVEHK